jgi:HEAT repeat protein
MATETLPTKQSPASIVVPPESDPQKAPALAATNVDKPQPPKPQPADKNAALPVAAHNVETLQSLLDELASPASDRRATAARKLGHLADPAAVPALIATLDDPDADVAREAATSLGLLKSAAVVEPVIAIVNNRDGFYHTVVRMAAIRSLAQLRDLRAVVPLLNAMRDPIAEVSAEAIRAVALLPDPRGLPALLEVIRNEHGFFLPTTRRAAILGLAQIGGEQAVCELRFVAGNEWEDAVVRAAAIEATREAPAATVGA